MDNTRLDALLSESLSQVPLPRDIPKKVNPWSALFRLLVWGILASLLGVGTEATSLQDMTEFELPQKKPQRVQPEGALDGYLYYQLDTGDTSASAPVLVIGFEKSKFFEDSLPVHILLTIPEHQVRIQLTGTVSAQTVVLTAPTSRMKDEDIQTLVQIRDTIQSVLQFVQSTADSMQKAG